MSPRGRERLPAHAGMVRHSGGDRAGADGASRARGDGPLYRKIALYASECSPRTRGWCRTPGGTLGLTIVLLAHAGMAAGDSRGEHDRDCFLQSLIPLALSAGDRLLIADIELELTPAQVTGV